jgi:hypothetical protein
MNSDRVREGRSRRALAREGYRLEKSRGRDSRALSWGLYRIVQSGNVVAGGYPWSYSMDLEEVEMFVWEPTAMKLTRGLRLYRLFNIYWTAVEQNPLYEWSSSAHVKFLVDAGLVRVVKQMRPDEVFNMAAKIRAILGKSAPQPTRLVEVRVAVTVPVQALTEDAHSVARRILAFGVHKLVEDDTPRCRRVIGALITASNLSAANSIRIMAELDAGHTPHPSLIEQAITL